MTPCPLQICDDANRANLRSPDIENKNAEGPIGPLWPMFNPLWVLGKTTAPLSQLKPWIHKNLSEKIWNVPHTEKGERRLPGHLPNGEKEVVASNLSDIFHQKKWTLQAASMDFNAWATLLKSLVAMLRP